MSTILLVGADSHLGREVRALLPQGPDVITDSSAFGLSDALQRGHLLDQIRRFGPFDIVLFCLDVNVQREVNYAVDIIPDVLSKPWLAMSVLQELYPQARGTDWVLATATWRSDSRSGLVEHGYEQDSVVAILDTAVRRFRAAINTNASLRLHESEGPGATLKLMRTLVPQP